MSQLSGPAATVHEKCIHNLPHARNRHFTGRERVLEAIGRSLAHGRGGTPVRAIYGAGGTGKTQLVLEYAYRHLNDYEIVWWLPADEPSTLALHRAKLAERLGLNAARGANSNEVRAALERELQRRSDWLLIYDNAAGPDEIRLELPQAGGHVLITSRIAGWDRVSGSFCLRVLERSEAVEFLRRRTGRAADEAADTLARALGDLPLALEQAAEVIEQTGISFADYLARFEDHWAELLASGRRSGDYPDTVAMTWELACRQVEQTNSDIAALLKVLAYLAPAEVPWSLLRKAVAALPVPLSSAFAIPLGLEDAIWELERFSLLAANDRAVFVHHLIGALTRDRLPDQQQHNWCQVALEMMQRTFRFDANAIESWGECGEALPHALAAAAHAQNATVAPDVGAKLLNQIGEYLLHVGSYEQARAMLERALALSDAAHGPEDPRRSAIANNLGRVLRRLGDSQQARVQFEGALAVDQAAYGHAHPHVAEVVNNYGTVLHSSGDIETALKQFEWALEICRDSYGPTHPKVATVTNNVAYALASSGELERALDHFTRALDAAEAACGPDHPLAASIRTNLGIALRLRGESDAARAQFERAAAIGESARGAAHTGLARSIAHLAALLQQEGDLESAKRCFHRALEIEREAVGPWSASLIPRLNDLGRCLKVLGDVDGSAACHAQAAEVLRRSRQPANAVTASASPPHPE